MLLDFCLGIRVRFLFALGNKLKGDLSLGNLVNCTALFHVKFALISKYIRQNSMMSLLVL